MLTLVGSFCQGLLMCQQCQESVGQQIEDVRSGHMTMASTSLYAGCQGSDETRSFRGFYLLVSMHIVLAYRAHIL